MYKGRAIEEWLHSAARRRARRERVTRLGGSVMTDNFVNAFGFMIVVGAGDTRGENTNQLYQNTDTHIKERKDPKG